MNIIKEVLQPYSRMEHNYHTYLSGMIFSRSYSRVKSLTKAQNLNKTQEDDVTSCLHMNKCHHNDPIKFIWGLSGTGKTKIIASMLFFLLNLKNVNPLLCCNYMASSFVFSWVTRNNFLQWSKARLLDKADEQTDMRLAKHIVSLHFKDHETVERDVLDISTLTDYVSYARKHIHPQLSYEVVDELITGYVKIRDKRKFIGSSKKIITTTPRKIESLLHLSEAFGYDWLLIKGFQKHVR